MSREARTFLGNLELGPRLQPVGLPAQDFCCFQASLKSPRVPEAFLDADGSPGMSVKVFEENPLLGLCVCPHTCTHVQQRHAEVRGQALVLFLRNTSTFLFEMGLAWPAGKLRWITSELQVLLSPAVPCCQLWYCKHLLLCVAFDVGSGEPLGSQACRASALLAFTG